MSGAYFTGYRSIDDARVKLAAMRAAGADWVALHGLPRFPPDDLRAIVTEAHKQGLRIMAERAARIGASVEVVSRPGAGCTVSLRLPRPDPRPVLEPPVALAA